MNVLTIIVIIIFAISILRGYRRGFIKSLASLASVILSIVLVHFASPYVTDFLRDNTPVYGYIVEKCEKAFQDFIAGQSGTDSAAPLRQDDVIDRMTLPTVLKDLLKENNTPEYYTELAARTFTEYIPRYMANLILTIISFVATWILVIAVIWIAVAVLNLMAELPVIHGINQVLGIFLGFVQGLLFVWVGFLFITVFGHTDTGRQLMAMISQSPLLETLYNSNIILDLLTDILGNFM